MPKRVQVPRVVIHLYDTHHLLRRDASHRVTREQGVHSVRLVLHSRRREGINALELEAITAMFNRRRDERHEPMESFTRLKNVADSHQERHRLPIPQSLERWLCG